jgi:hypothetical protein
LEFNNIQDKAVSTPGLFVKTLERSPSGFLVNGLLDPLADLSQLQNLGVQFQTTSFISLDSEMILKRANRILKDFPEASIALVDNNFILTGRIQINRLNQLKQRLNSTPGINTIVDQTIVDIDADLKGFFNAYSSQANPINYQLNQQTLYLEGRTTYEKFDELSNKFKEQFNSIELNIENLNILDSNEKIIDQINTTKIQMPNLKDSTEAKKLATLINSLHLLLQREVLFKLTVLGSSDCNGVISDQKSLQRVEIIKNILKDSNLPLNLMTFDIKKCNSFDLPRDSSKRTVDFKVNQ